MLLGAIRKGDSQKSNIFPKVGSSSILCEEGGGILDDYWMDKTSLHKNPYSRVSGGGKEGGVNTVKI